MSRPPKRRNSPKSFQAYCTSRNAPDPRTGRARRGPPATRARTRRQLPPPRRSRIRASARGRSWPGSTAIAWPPRQPGGAGAVRLVAAEKAFVVLRVSGRQEGIERSFEQVREQLAAKVAREGKTRTFEALVGRLRSEARVRIDDAALERTVVK